MQDSGPGECDRRRRSGQPRVLYVDGHGAGAPRPGDAALQRFGQRAFGFEAHSKPRAALAALEHPDIAVIVAAEGALDAVDFLARARRLSPAYRVLLVGDEPRHQALQIVNDAGVHRIVTRAQGWQRLDATICELVERARGDWTLEERASRAERYQAELAELQNALRRLTGAQGCAVLDVLLSALSLREGSAISHSHRASRYAALLGRACELEARDLALVELGTLLHDVGKLGISEGILAKPGSLSGTEWREIRRHPALGDRLLGALPLLSEARPIVLQHHERWDGRGYPAGLARGDIHMGARICAVADTLDAMTSARPYRQALSFEQAWDEIRRCGGSQFDPAVVERFESIGAQVWQRALCEVSADEDPASWSPRLSSLLAVDTGQNLRPAVLATRASARPVPRARCVAPD